MNRKTTYFMLIIAMLIPFMTIMSRYAYSESRSVVKVNSPVKVDISVDIDSSYDIILEEIRITIDPSIFGQTNGSWPYDLWYDLGAKLNKGPFGIENIIKDIVDKKITELSAGEEKVIMTQIYTSDIAGYEKMNGTIGEIVIRIWYSGAIDKPSIVSPHKVDLKFLNIDPMEILNALNLSVFAKMKLILPEPLTQRGKGVTIAIQSSSVLPFSRTLPAVLLKVDGTLNIGARSYSTDLDAVIRLPPDTLLSASDGDSIEYYTIGDMMPLLTVVMALIVIAAISIFKAFFEPRRLP